MHTRYPVRRDWKRIAVALLLAALSAATAVTLSACGPETLVVGLEPTPTPLPSPTPVIHSYVNDQYGFAFEFPETWSLIEQPQLLKLRAEAHILSIAYGWLVYPQFKPMDGMTGTPAGDWLYRGKVSFLGNELPVQVLGREVEDTILDVMVLYGEGSLLEVDDLAFSIWLMPVAGADEDDTAIPQTVQAEAMEILSSFRWVESTGSPPEPTATRVPSPETDPIASGDRDLSIYSNDEYQVALIYPAIWQLDETSVGDINLTWDSYHLHMQFSREGGEIMPEAGGEHECTIQVAGSVMVLGSEIGKKVQVCGGETRSVFLNGRFGDLRLFAQLDDRGADLPQSAQMAFESVLGSLHRTGEAKTFTMETLVYENKAFGFSFHYPASWTVVDMPGETMADGTKLADAVTIRQGDFGIVVQYRWLSDAGPIAWGGSAVPGGLGYAEAVLGQRVNLLGEDTHKYMWSYGGHKKAIAVNTSGKRSDLLLSIALCDSTVRVVDERAETLSQSAIAALDQVLSSFAFSR